MKIIRDIDLKNKKVLVRADFNVPLDAGLDITDDNRIRAVLPTMTHVLDQGAALILCSHLGRPKGVDKTKSLAPVAKRLGELLGRAVSLAPDCLGPEVERMAAALAPGQVLLLENLRFQPGESKNDEAMGRELAGLADVYVNDAFATAHRAHASNVAVARFARVKAAGFLLENEIAYFHRALVNPARPVAAIVGGAKIDTKIGALENLIKSVDKLLIGGAMANTFLKSQGYEVGASLCQPELAPIAACILKLAAEHGVK
ncbi:MAG: phosphoglycerate kinase, partial [Thermodesulfobacteriota bacterium]